MKLITISGIPASGKTTLGKKLGEEKNCLSFELENLRWEFFKNNEKNNMYKYTNNNKTKENESYRDYYLRNTVYENNISSEIFKIWNKETINYINSVANEIYNTLKGIEKDKDLEKLKNILSTYKDFINYIPDKISLDIIDTVIISHVFASSFDIAKLTSDNIILNEKVETCKNRFKERENINTNKYDNNITNYLNNCYLCLNDINKNDVRIKNAGYNFHYRVAGIIMQNDKFLIQQIDGYNYFILPGGHVLLGESSKKAIEREIKEEVGNDIEIDNCKLFCFHENFYNKKEKVEHWIECYYLVEIKNNLNNKNWDVEENDKGEIKKLHFKWVNKEELKEIDLKPTSIKKLLLENKYNQFNYLIDGDD